MVFFGALNKGFHVSWAADVVVFEIFPDLSSLWRWACCDWLDGTFVIWISSWFQCFGIPCMLLSRYGVIEKIQMYFAGQLLGFLCWAWAVVYSLSKSCSGPIMAVRLVQWSGTAAMRSASESGELSSHSLKKYTAKRLTRISAMNRILGSSIDSEKVICVVSWGVWSACTFVNATPRISALYIAESATLRLSCLRIDEGS